MENNKKLGLLIIGISGSVGSTIFVGTKLSNLPEFKNVIDIGLITKSLNQFFEFDLFDLSDIVVNGWDVNELCYENSIEKYKVFTNYELIKFAKNLKYPKHYDAILTSSDFHVNQNKGISITNYKEAIGTVRQNIVDFKSKYSLENVVVVNLASPHKNIEWHTWFDDSKEFFKKIESNDEAITSGMLYCLASIYENCPFVDFTPSATLLPKAIIVEANRYKVPIAGRDGSTGQTLMKSVLSTMFVQRNLKVRGWYSTNILGNLDGYVLSDENYNKEKINDKTDVLNKVLGYNPEHLVEIKYFKCKGDSKEAWDYIEFEGWLGEIMQLKINWVGKDSLLAAPLVLDLVRLIAFSKLKGLYGMQKQLSVFFKHPLLTEERSFTKLFSDFINFYKNI